MAFPVLTIGPDADSLTFRPAYNNTTEVRMENGLRSTRARHTSVPKVWSMKYTGLTDQDRLDVQAYFEWTTSMGSDAFDWINPQDYTTTEVKFYGEPSFVLDAGLLPERRWNMDISFIETGS